MRRHLATLLIALIAASGAAIGSGYETHAQDTANSQRQSVNDFNDGFLDGACAGSPQVAQSVYGARCGH